MINNYFINSTNSKIIKQHYITDQLHLSVLYFCKDTSIESTDEKTTKKTHIQRLQYRLDYMEKEMRDLKEQYIKEKQKADIYYTKYKDLKNSGNFPLMEKAGRHLRTMVNRYTGSIIYICSNI